MDGGWIWGQLNVMVKGGRETGGRHLEQNWPAASLKISRNKRRPLWAPDYHGVPVENISPTGNCSISLHWRRYNSHLTARGSGDCLWISTAHALLGRYSSLTF